MATKKTPLTPKEGLYQIITKDSGYLCVIDENGKEIIHAKDSLKISEIGGRLYRATIDVYAIVETKIQNSEEER